METIILNSEPLPETETTITLDFFDPRDLGTRGTHLPAIKGREGKITFNPDGCQVFSLSHTSGRNPAQTTTDSTPWDLYLIRIPFTLHKVPGTSYYQEITFLVEIADQQKTAFDLFPRHIASVSRTMLYATVAPDFTITETEESDQHKCRQFCFTDIRPTITAFGEGEATFYWVYEASPGQQGVAPGTKHILIVLQVPHGTQSVAAFISAEAVIAKQSADVRKIPNMVTEPRQVQWDLSRAIPFCEAASTYGRTGLVQADQRGASSRDRYDVCVTCALADEARTFMQIAEQHYGAQFDKAFDKRLKLEYYHTSIRNIQGEFLTVQVSWPLKYGPWEISLHLKPLFETFQPRFAAMTGICAGDKQRVKLGDLIIADRAYFYDSGKFVIEQSGKRAQQPDIDLYPANPEIRRFIQTFEYERFIQTLEHWKSLVTQHNPKCCIGVMASGSAVRADHLFDKAQFPVRGTLAIDMEGAAFYRVAMDFPGMPALLAKGVSDYADSTKNDFYRQYASAISAMYVLTFIREYVTSDHMPRTWAH